MGEEKERYEMQALAAKEKYHAALVKYKKTDEYIEYAKYLAEFKAKNAATTGEYCPIHCPIAMRCGRKDSSSWECC